jgi:uncharacterized protein YukJ
MTTPAGSTERAHRGPTRPTAKGIQVYGVVRGRPVRTKVAQPPGDQPHYHILVQTTDNHQFDIAVDVQDRDGSNNLHAIVNPFTPPDPSGDLALEPGATTIGSAGEGGLGLDYIRQNLITRDQMTPIDVGNDPVNQFSNDLTDFVNRAIADPSAEVFAFGKLYAAASSGRPNEVFGFSPDLGAHDIHLNQGNATGSNAVFEDGALLVHYPGDGHWEAAFIAFQDQSFQTDATGRPTS